ncbi:MAG TPA: MBL fold metallo-hydrolase [Deltaproteobacteria bacterium]|nr:MAG: metal-dependent hydrolase [Deltaproteobacteria bacterium GWA2_55_82]OGQ64945.1 MAG: metal-dependent hydrolase [Deltaproteobacteria bacterium RIFCSPLOWO2_02_FULL_55_12]OIJ73875.1 MAG: metal-dependent hydrolase [Deltaproteobacteria bacterium GWC2_55_46]HBG46305.1 MBL fold metallo-hydrolase [Deltaproteobacteria bacterium]HCY09865.1 MBL fold metallo-hydrolase [Deltaproteobacteria bacterium]
MLIRCWGSRGSIPVSGKDYIKYGGDTTCVEVISNSGDLIIIDAGTGIRRLGKRLVAEGQRKMHLLLTHGHWDHLSGFPFFKPIYRKESEIKIYGPETTQDSLKKIISKTMTAPNFPVEFEDINADISFLGMGPKSYSIGSVNISTIPLSHPNHGLGYKLEEDGRSFVFLTDNELAFRHPFGVGYDDYKRFCEKADLLFHDAEYKKEEYESETRGWGHSTYLDTLDLAIGSGVKRLGLFHQNQDRTDAQVDEIVRECKEVIKKKGSSLECFAVAAGTEVSL